MRRCQSCLMRRWLATAAASTVLLPSDTFQRCMPAPISCACPPQQQHELFPKSYASMHTGVALQLYCRTAVSHSSMHVKAVSMLA